MQLFVIINSIGMMINVDCECKELIKKCGCYTGCIWNPIVNYE